MKRIDAHQHFWAFKPNEYSWIGETVAALRQDWLPPALKGELQREQIDACIAVQARSEERETDFLLGLAGQYGFIAGVVGWIDLRAPDLAQRLERWKDQPKLRGFRHALQDEPDAGRLMQDAAFLSGIHVLQSRHFVYEVLIRPNQLDAAVKFCAQADSHWLVLDHLGKPAIRDRDHDSWRRKVLPLRDMPHVLCKMSGLVTEADRRGGFEAAEIRPYLDSALEIFGAQRLMFGSDWPVCLPSASYAQVCQLIRDWAKPLSGGEQDALWGGTAVRTYSLGLSGASSWI